MLKTFYIQIEKDTNRITDIIEYAYSDYKEVQLDIPLPPAILGGAYKLVGDSTIYVQEWDASELKGKVDILIAENRQIKEAMHVLFADANLDIPQVLI